MAAVIWPGPLHGARRTDPLQAYVANAVARATAEGILDADICTDLIPHNEGRMRDLIRRALTAKQDFVLAFGGGYMVVSDEGWFAQAPVHAAASGWAYVVRAQGKVYRGNLSRVDSGKLKVRVKRLLNSHYKYMEMSDSGCVFYFGRRDGKLWSRVVTGGSRTPEGVPIPGAMLLGTFDSYIGRVAVGRR